MEPRWNPHGFFRFIPACLLLTIRNSPPTGELPGSIDPLFRRDWPHFIAFAVPSIDGENLQGRPLVERQRRLRAIMPRIESGLVYLDHVVRRGSELFTAVCQHDLEGIVAEWKRGRYHSDGMTTSWLKIRNPAYPRMQGRPILSIGCARAAHAGPFTSRAA